MLQDVARPECLLLWAGSSSPLPPPCDLNSSSAISIMLLLLLRVSRLGAPGRPLKLLPDHSKKTHTRRRKPRNKGGWHADGLEAKQARALDGMARGNRRDCRTRVPKKNHMNARVEELQKSIRKTKKAGGEPAAASAPAQLTSAASDFLSQMRSETHESISKLRSATAPAPSTAT